MQKHPACRKQDTGQKLGRAAVIAIVSDGKGKRKKEWDSCMGVTVRFSKEAPLFAQLHVDDVVVSENLHESRLRCMRAQIACKQLPTVPPVHRAKIVFIMTCSHFVFFLFSVWDSKIHESWLGSASTGIQCCPESTFVNVSGQNQRTLVW